MDLYSSGEISRRQAVQEAFRNQDYRNYVELTRKKSRVAALIDIRGEFGLYDDASNDFWPLVGEVWQQSENSGTEPARHYWRDIWSYVFDDLGKRTPFSETVMNEDECAIFDQLPNTLTVWRGYRSEPAGCCRGLSWSLSEPLAKWFAARRSGGVPMLAKGRISKSAALAFFNRCHEAEIVAMPEMVKDVATYQIDEQPLSERVRPRCEVDCEAGQIRLSYSYPEPVEPTIHSIEGDCEAFLDDEEAA